MKRFLKPTGQLLTTAVLTSAALEPISAAAQSVPQPPTPEGESRIDAVSPEAGHQPLQVDAETEAIVPPEASSSGEFMQGARAQAAAYRTALRSQVSQGVGAHAASYSSSSSRVAQAIAPLSHTAPSIPSSDDVRDDLASSSGSLSISSRSQSLDVLLSQSAPSLPSTAEEEAQGESQIALDSSTDDVAQQSQSLSPPLSQGISQVTPPESVSNPSRLTSPASGSNSDDFEQGATGQVEETREWLDNALTQIVERDRTQRETQLRENLVNSAHQRLDSRNVAEARRLANNPALTESERNDLMEAIADVEDRRFYPFVSAERAASAARPQVNEAPSQDWLIAQMNAYSDSSNANCVAVSAHLPNEHTTVEESQAQVATTYRPVDEEFVSGGEFLAGIGHQAPSIYANKSETLSGQSRTSQVEMNQTQLVQPGLEQSRATQPSATQSGMSQVGGGAGGSSASWSAAVDSEAIARVGDCPPTLGQHIGGVAFAALSGYEWMNQTETQHNRWQMSFPLPVSAPITSRFGWRSHPIFGNRRFHNGIDFGAPAGTPVLAALPGRVQTSGSISGYGLTIIIENDELQQRNLYAHMSRLAVPAGTWVEQGTVIGWVGSTGNSTGPHLHFEVHHRSGNSWTAVDPLQAAAQMLANRRRR